MKGLLPKKSLNSSTELTLVVVRVLPAFYTSQSGQRIIQTKQNLCVCVMSSALSLLDHQKYVSTLHSLLHCFYFELPVSKACV